MTESSEIQVGAEDLVIYGDDGKYYLVKKEVYTQTELPRVLQGTPQLMVTYGSVLATVDPGTNPGVGCACYILNLTAVRKPKPIGT